ncbi:radical SAM protein [Candidatus Bathyarchaeota archaeon]|nr:radical SAM protein [Candidatus Bathyarchaeota archaeon]
MENSSDVKTFYVYANKWCPRRGLESSRLCRYFVVNNLKAVSDPKKADLIVIFTCGLFAANEEFSILTIEKSLKNKSAKIVITGCLLKIDADRLKAYDTAIRILPEDLGKLDSLIRAKVPYHELPNAAIVQGIHDLYHGNLLSKSGHYVERNAERALSFGLLSGSEDILFAPTTYKLEIAKGCLGKCSYCAIKLGMEKFHSFPEEQILESFRSGLKGGYKNFALLAGDIGCYGIDRQTNLSILLKKLFAVDGDFKILLWDLNAGWFIKYYPELRSVLRANSAKVSKIVIPIESGSDRILSLMNRGYGIEKVKEYLLDLLRTIPDINVETQIIAGFPGETDEDFRKTLEIVRAIRFSKVVVFRYEDRPNTKASDLPDKVPKSIIDKRARVLAKEVKAIVVN